MRSLGSFWRVVFVIIFSIVLLTACGGGGSGSGTAPGDPPVAPGDSGSDSVPDGPPPLVSPDYGGATGMATIDQSNAGILALEMMIMVQNSVGFAYEVPSLPSGDQTINRTQAGPDGGQAVIQGQANSVGTGWITLDYQNYKVSASETTFTYDGMIQIRFDFAPTGGRIQATVDLAGLTISTLDGSETFTGTVTRVAIVTNDRGMLATQYTTDLAVHDHSLNGSLKADYQIIDGSSGVTVSGKLFDSRIGYVTVASLKPMHFGVFDGTQTPKGGGSTALTGSGSNTAILAGLNGAFAAVGMDTDGDGLMDESTRIDWKAFNFDTTPTLSGAPEADAVSRAQAELGNTVKLDGRYSHSPNADFIHFNWSLVAAPAGSTVELSDQHNAVATFVPDVAGDYLFRLEASGSAGSSADALVVQAVPAGDLGADAVPEAGPDRTAGTGTKVALDGRASISRSGSTGINTWSWDLYPPPGSHAVLDNVNAVQPTFTPDVPGYYDATLSVDGCCNYKSRAIIDVDGPVHFDPAVGFGPNLNADVVAVGDLNHDGLKDIVFGPLGAIQTEVIIYNLGNGHFSPPVSAPVGDGVRLIAIKDINGDGLADLVTLPYDGLDYRLQQPDGTLAPVVHVDEPSGSSCSQYLVVAKLFGSTRNSVLTGGCGQYVNVYPPVAGGSVGTPISIAVGAFTHFGLAVGDVTGDGIADLVTTTDNPSFALLVSAGQTDGTFAPAVSYPISQTANSILVGDLNGDGLNDVVLPDGNNFDIVFQQSDGSLKEGKMLVTAGSAGMPAIGDINGDGRTDLIAGEGYYYSINGAYRDEIGLFIQGADGSLSQEYLYPDSNTSGSNKIIADLNGDGVADILAVGGTEMTIMYGDPLNPAGSGQVQTLQTQALVRSPAKSSALRAVGVLPLPPLHLQLQVPGLP